MKILQEDNGKSGSFYLEENEKRIAELAYTWRGKDLMSIDHTEVDEELEGKGVGSALVERSVDFARENHIRVILYCPFAKTIFKRKPEYNDVLFHSAI
jgi:predicted GNAT family acetyltransferase